VLYVDLPDSAELDGFFRRGAGPLDRLMMRSKLLRLMSEQDKSDLAQLDEGEIMELYTDVLAVQNSYINKTPKYILTCAAVFVYIWEACRSAAIKKGAKKALVRVQDAEIKAAAKRRLKGKLAKVSGESNVLANTSWHVGLVADTNEMMRELDDFGTFTRSDEVVETIDKINSYKSKVSIQALTSDYDSIDFTPTLVDNVDAHKDGVRVRLYPQTVAYLNILGCAYDVCPFFWQDVRLGVISRVAVYLSDKQFHDAFDAEASLAVHVLTLNRRCRAHVEKVTSLPSLITPVSWLMKRIGGNYKSLKMVGGIVGNKAIDVAD